MAVLATKLHGPAPRPDLVPRGRLQQQLAPAGHAFTRLILFCAPAGFGKTTALTQWLGALTATRPVRVAWVSLDSDDNDPTRFLAHLIAALQQSAAEIGVDAQAVLEGGGPARVQAAVESLVNDLEMLADRTIIALDDYHVITGPAVHDVLEFLLGHLPDHVQIAMTTRSDPPLPIARLRSNGGLVELRAADLRFTADEAAALLNGVVGHEVDRASVDILDQRTEGWAAGLRLAGLSLRGRDDMSAFVAEFAGSHRFVLDYLVEEVLSQQPGVVTEFLLRTSVLTEMNAELCQTLTGRSDAAEILAALERDNVFVIALDEQRAWYRYHHLIADALQARLRETRQADVVELHRTASRWFVEHGILDEAIAHAREGGDPQRTAQLVELALPGLRRERRDDTARGHVRGISEDVVRRRALLATFMAWSCLADGDLRGVEGWLDRAEAALEHPQLLDDDLLSSQPGAARAHHDELRQLPAMIAVYRATVAQARGDVGGTVMHARRALELTEPTDHFPRGAAAGFLGLAAWAAGDLGSATDTFSRAVDSLRAAGNIADELGSTVVLAGLWLGRGRPDKARRLYEEAIDTADRHRLPLSTTGDLHVGLADVLREEGDLDAADAHLTIARQLGDAASLPENRYRWYAAAGGVRWACGDLDGALAMLERAEQLYQPGFFPNVSPIPAARARAHLARGDLEAAAEWATTIDTSLDAPAAYLQECNQLTLVRLLLARRAAGLEVALDDVLDLLERLLSAATTADRAGSVIEILVVRALAHAAADDTTAAVRDLGDALAAGYPAGYRRLFLDEGPRLARVLREVARAETGDPATYAQRLLAERLPSRMASVRPGTPSGDEALSDRELEVLRLLATDLTGPEIARRLYVSVNTLRTHTKHIFTKLRVNTRRAAVSRAAELGLL